MVAYTRLDGKGSRLCGVNAAQFKLGFTKGSPVLHPNQFQVNEAWIAFTLNESPIRTERDGSFNCICLMDAASCFILASTLVPLNEAEPTQLEARRLFKMARAHKVGKPTRLFVPAGQFETNLRAEAKRQGLDVIPVNEGQLSIFIGEARQGFREYVQSGAPKGET